MAKSKEPVGEILRRGDKKEWFIGQLETIRLAISSGQTIRKAYGSSSSVEVMSYDMFREYVGRFLDEESKIQRYRTTLANRSPISPPVSNLDKPPDSHDPPMPPAPSTLIQTPKENSHEPKRGPLPVVRQFRPHKGPAKESDVWG